MSKEIWKSRRENGITIRFLAQCLINNIVFPDQKGIMHLMAKAKNGKGILNKPQKNKTWKYWFLFHMEDFMQDTDSKNKSELDLLLRCGTVLYSIEVKAFTNPNATDVKREIIRNYLALKAISKNSQLFDPVSDIVPVLLYSEPVHHMYNTSSESYNYFKSEFLYKKGYKHEQEMDVWSSSSFQIPWPDKCSEEEKLAKVMQISEKLLFLTWDDVLNTLDELNNDGQFSSVINELSTKIDIFGQHKNTRLCMES